MGWERVGEQVVGERVGAGGGAGGGGTGGVGERGGVCGVGERGGEGGDRPPPPRRASCRFHPHQIPGTWAHVAARHTWHV